MTQQDETNIKVLKYLIEAKDWKSVKDICVALNLASPQGMYINRALCTFRHKGWVETKRGPMQMKGATLNVHRARIDEMPTDITSRRSRFTI